MPDGVMTVRNQPIRMAQEVATWAHHEPWIPVLMLYRVMDNYDELTERLQAPKKPFICPKRLEERYDHNEPAGFCFTSQPNPDDEKTPINIDPLIETLKRPARKH